LQNPIFFRKIFSGNAFWTFGGSCKTNQDRIGKWPFFTETDYLSTVFSLQSVLGREAVSLSGNGFAKNLIHFLPYSHVQLQPAVTQWKSDADPCRCNGDGISTLEILFLFFRKDFVKVLTPLKGVLKGVPFIGVRNTQWGAAL
jgi:hypothetical protein